MLMLQVYTLIIVEFPFTTSFLFNHTCSFVSIFRLIQHLPHSDKQGRSCGEGAHPLLHFRIWLISELYTISLRPSLIIPIKIYLRPLSKLPSYAPNSDLDHRSISLALTPKRDWGGARASMKQSAASSSSSLRTILARDPVHRS